MVSGDQPRGPNMGKAKIRRRKVKTNSQCMPRRLRPTGCGGKNHPLAPTSLLGRLREAVFGLAMLSSALSKATQEAEKGGPVQKRTRYYVAEDPRRYEAVADCIEFIKKNRDSATRF
ncbi:hypothetical protein NMG60_11026299 [Bertholletia excelsa]